MWYPCHNRVSGAAQSHVNTLRHAEHNSNSLLVENRHEGKCKQMKKWRFLPRRIVEKGRLVMSAD